jgi:hypothetical protein
MKNVRNGNYYFLALKETKIERERRVNVKEEELYLFKYKLSSPSCECSLLRKILITSLVFVNFGILKPFTCNLQLIVSSFLLKLQN